VCSKRFYDADDMKVQCDGEVLRQIGKGLAPAETDAESIGMLFFRDDGPRLFREALDRAVTSAQAVRQWYLSVVNDMAAEGLVGVVPIDGLEWAEIDYIRDLQIAEQMVGAWQNDEAFPAVRPAAWPG
jgi:choline kinase